MSKKFDWNFYPQGPIPGSNPCTMLYNSFIISEVMKYEGKFNGYSIDNAFQTFSEETRKEIVDFFSESMTLVSHAIAYNSRYSDNHSGDFLFVSEDSFAYLNLLRNGSQIRFFSRNKDLTEKVSLLLDKVRTDPPKENHLWAIMYDGGCLDIKPISKIEKSFEPGNYTDTVIADYEHIISDLSSKTPCGRLSILDGPPGTGKTHLVRSIIGNSSVDDGLMFVVIPANIAPKLSGPELISLLIDNNAKEKAIILIFEDADELLAPRKFDNISSVSEMLNLSDGLIGNCLNIKIIATTNAAVTDFDKAIMRPGRLCRKIHIGSLTNDHARKIYERLGGKDFVEKKSGYTLAEVYSLAKKGA